MVWSGQKTAELAVGVYAACCGAAPFILAADRHFPILPTPDEALNLLTEQANAFKTKIAEVTTSLKQEAEKHQGSVAEQLNAFARNLNNSIHDAATSLNLQDQLNSLQSALTNVGHQWQDIATKTQASAQEAWAPVQSALQEAAEKTKQAAANLQNSIQSAVQKPAN